MFILNLLTMFCFEKHGGFNNFHSTQVERVNIKQLPTSIKEINTLYRWNINIYFETEHDNYKQRKT